MFWHRSCFCSYMSQILRNKFDHFAETTLPSLFNLIPNSAKIMASSGKVCLYFIIEVSLYVYF